MFNHSTADDDERGTFLPQLTWSEHGTDPPAYSSGALGARPKRPQAVSGKVVQLRPPGPSQDGLTYSWERPDRAAETEARIQQILRRPASANPLDLEQATHRERTNRQAKRTVDAEERADLPIGDPVLLQDLKADPVEYYVEGILPQEVKAMIIAESKVGKTTFLLNLACSLTTGAPFLGHYPAQPISGKILFLNYELSAHKFREEARRIGVDESQLLVFQGRENSNPFSHAEQRDRIVEIAQMHDIEIVVIDPLSNAFPYSEQDSNSQMRAFLNEAWELVRDCGAATMIIAAHSGKDASKGARGAGAIEDDADVLIRLSKVPRGEKRRVSVGGRYDHLSNQTLDFDEESHRLSLAPEKASQEAAEQFDNLSDLDRVLQLIGNKPGIAKADLQGFSELGQKRFRAVWNSIRAQAEEDPGNAPVQFIENAYRKVTCYLSDELFDEVEDEGVS